MARRRDRDSDSPLPKLGELELAALEHLWAVHEADVAETHAQIGLARGITVNTVGSALERLYRKGLVAREKVSHAYRYRPALEREDFRARRLIEAAGGLAALSDQGLLAAFVDVVADSDAAALDQLAALVRQKRANTKARRAGESDPETTEPRRTRKTRGPRR